MSKKKENEIKQCNNKCVTIRLYNKKGILKIPKKHPIYFSDVFWMFAGCFLDVFKCLEHPITSEIQIYVGYVFEKKETTFHISSIRKK